jgi:hypothetical protein
VFAGAAQNDGTTVRCAVEMFESIGEGCDELDIDRVVRWPLQFDDRHVVVTEHYTDITKLPGQ